LVFFDTNCFGTGPLSIDGTFWIFDFKNLKVSDPQLLSFPRLTFYRVQLLPASSCREGLPSWRMAQLPKVKIADPHQFDADLDPAYQK
jgi:hypothetical protein